MSEDQRLPENMVKDSLGRIIKFRELDELTESRLVRNLGNEIASNGPYMQGYVIPAAAVAEIDGEEYSVPTKLLHIDKVITDLGKSGMNAARLHIYGPMLEAAEKAKDDALKN